MNPQQLQAWLSVIAGAEQIGETLVTAIKAHAKLTLTDAEYADLESAWQADANRAKRNAGL